MRLVLASASPRRAELLTAAGFSFETHVVDLDERRRDESPADYVRRLAREKAARAFGEFGPAKAGHYVRQADGIASGVVSGFSRTLDDLVVLGADTAVVVDDEVLGKPRDDADARAMLRRLSGRSHEVMTGVSLKSQELEVGSAAATTVWFADLTEAVVDWYVSTGEGRDKAGAYAIQGLASRFIPRIDGSYSNVVGLPVALVAALIQRFDRAPGITY
jgi:septum formation protein